MKYDHSYDDIINLPHHKSNKHPSMSLYARSSQFAAFAALTGYEDAVKETARTTSERIELDEELKFIIDGKLQLLKENISKKEEVTITYFVPDCKKSGGQYVTKIGVIKKFDEINQSIIFLDNSEIPINEIIQIVESIVSRN